VLVLLLAAAVPVAAAGATETPAADAVREAEAKHRLDALRDQIRQISDAQRATDAKKTTAATALREQEIKVASAVKALRATDQELEKQQRRFGDLNAQRDGLDAKLHDQRAALAALLRSAYAMGNAEELKLLLAQERVDEIGRMLAYYRYFERSRVAQIESLLHDLAALARVQKALDEATAELRQTRAQQAEESARLETERAERVRILGELDATLKDQQQRLAALGKDEKALVDLIARLRDVFADIPKQIAGEEPFAQLRGRLNWPVRGKTVAPATADEGEHESRGLLIATPSGSEVRAVSHGRVVFADWLRGFGLLLIMDHGDGYLSLYGYNEALLKEVGDWVDANDVIATSGASGGRKTPGVYFELRYQGKALDPKGWLKASSH